VQPLELFIGPQAIKLNAIQLLTPITVARALKLLSKPLLQQIVPDNLFQALPYNSSPVRLIVTQDMPQILLGQPQQVRVPNRSHIGGAPIPRPDARYIQNAQLAKKRARLQRHKHLGPVIANHIQHSPLHHKHLIANVTLLAHKVPGAEHLRHK